MVLATIVLEVRPPVFVFTIESDRVQEPAVRSRTALLVTRVLRAVGARPARMKHSFPAPNVYRIEAEDPALTQDVGDEIAEALERGRGPDSPVRRLVVVRKTEEANGG